MSRTSKLLFGTNIIAAFVIMFTVPIPADALPDPFVDCCRKDTSGNRFCCDECCVGDFDGCDDNDDCELK